MCWMMLVENSSVHLRTSHDKHWICCRLRINSLRHSLSCMQLGPTLAVASDKEHQWSLMVFDSRRTVDSKSTFHLKGLCRRVKLWATVDLARLRYWMLRTAVGSKDKGPLEWVSGWVVINWQLNSKLLWLPQFLRLKAENLESLYTYCWSIYWGGPGIPWCRDGLLPQSQCAKW